MTTDVTPAGLSRRCRLLSRAADPLRGGGHPHQVFYDRIEAGRPYVRWAFCKRDEVLDEAVERLAPALRPVA